jgi:hypothetical protein
MKIIPTSRKNRDIAVAIIFLAVIALSVWLVSWLSARYNLTISSTEGGEVTTPGEGTFTYDEGTVVNLVVEAEEGYYFVNWAGDVSAINDVNADATSITMNGHYSINANFGLEIRDWYDLYAVRDNLAGNYTLMNDLDSTTLGYEELASPTANGGKGWEPIGTRVVSASFTGPFDGQGYEIRDLFINRPVRVGVGLFGSVYEGAIIKNVGVVNVTVVGDSIVGGLMGRNEGTVTTSYFTGNVTGNDWVGGLVGYNYGSTVGNSYSTGNVTGDEHVGGLVGYTYYGTISNSHATGNVTGNQWVGGLVGYNKGGTVSNSYATGSVTGTSCVGGLVGHNRYHGTVTDSYSTGNVTGDEYVGGLVGENDGGTVSSSFWDTETSGQTTSDGGTGKITQEMQDITTFSEAVWDIVAVTLNQTNLAYIWNIVDAETYPFLSWQS